MNLAFHQVGIIRAGSPGTFVSYRYRATRGGHNVWKRLDKEDLALLNAISVFL